MFKLRNTVSYLAVATIVIGVVITIVPLIYFEATFPVQDEPIKAPLEVTKVLASPSPTSTEVAVSKVEVPVPLYSLQPKLDSKIGTITLPTLGLSWPIFEGTTDAQLAKGVGHFVGAVLPGMIDNSVLSGHRSTVFNDLGALEKGDLIYVQTSAGTFTYEVQSFRIVKRTNRSVIVPTKTGILTLTTCYPFNFVGKTTDAYIVTATLINSDTSLPIQKESRIWVNRSRALSPVVCKV